MNIRIVSQFVAVLAVVLIVFSTALQPAVLAAPAFQSDSYMAEGQEYTVQAGDSLYKISSEFLGNGALWPQIQEATNAMAAEDDSFATIDQPRLIRAGQKIWIPTESAGAMMDEPSEGMDADMDHGDVVDDDADHDMSSDGGAMDVEGADSGVATQALSDAAAQLAIAVSHAGLLSDSLAADDLAMAQAHAEHVINILDGEDGRNFGDINRDGKTQNPGDGVGVRGYLEQAGAVDGSGGDSPTLTDQAIDTARKIMAVDTAGEAAAIVDELAAELDQLSSSISEMQSVDEGMAGDSNDEMMSHGSDGGALLFDEADGLFASAATQVQIAIAHSGFLADELDSDALDAAKSHAEHVINILDGEDGLFYGDNNRDGQTQNPGDGIGVRVYLEQALAQVRAAGQDADEELATSLEEGLALVKNASNGAIAIIATDTSEDAAPVAEALAASLADLQTAVGAMQNMAPAVDEVATPTSGDDGSESIADDKSTEATDDTDESATMADTEMAGTEMAEDVALAVAALVSEESGGGLLLKAQAQAEVAINHFAFLQDSLAGDDLVMALTHAEHVINILDGEDGLLFGDNNRDGKTQNPGDGIGVRVYLVRANEQIMTALGGADAGDVQSLLDAIQQSEKAASDGAAGAVRLFASSSAADAQAVAGDLGTLLDGLEASIATAVAAATP